jgi:hypothetical protein
MRTTTTTLLSTETLQNRAVFCRIRSKIKRSRIQIQIKIDSNARGEDRSDSDHAICYKEMISTVTDAHSFATCGN